MDAITNGSFRLLRVWGISLYLHWTWFILLAIEFFNRGMYQDKLWNVLELLVVFAIVTLHEFGHALACRSVGGQANTIVLWPLGGVAFVQPPRRPGAVLWSIVAGPLVNVVLFPILFVLLLTTVSWRADTPWTNAEYFVFMIFWINTVLLCFNLLPIYPLDGGQILQSLLWFFIGQARSLRIVAVIGMVAGGLGFLGGVFLFTRSQNFWPAILALFVISRAWHGYKVARQLAIIEEREAALANPWQHAQDRLQR